MPQTVNTLNQPPDILRLPLNSWNQVLGNYRSKRKLQQLVRRIRSQVRITGQIPDANRLCLLLTGASRSGKTAMVKLFVRSLSCQALNEETLDPCNRTCSPCRQRAEQFGLQGIDAAIAVEDARKEVHFSVVDCTKIHTPEQLREHLIGVNDWQDGLRIYYFDEVHRLVNRQMDEMLLKEVEEKNFLWIFSTAKPQNLEDMFVNRLIKLETELPTSAEMEQWLCDRCDEWGINWQPEAILRVVEKSNQIVGTALHALALAAIDPDEGLTLDLVENDWRVKLDE